MAFSVGTLLALTLILIIATVFSTILKATSYTRQIASGLIFLLAVLVYFDILVTQSNKQIEARLSSLDPLQENFPRIIGVGFIVSFITLIDDMFVLVPLFLHDNFTSFLAVIGVYFAAILIAASRRMTSPFKYSFSIIC